MGMKAVFLDTETTDRTPGSIAQLSYIVVEDEVISKTFNQFLFVNEMSKGAAEVTGREAAFYQIASCGKKFYDIGAEVYNDLHDATIIGHNIGFDIRFLQHHFKQHSVDFKPKDTIDTMKVFRESVGAVNKNGILKAPNLGELSRYLKLKDEAVSMFVENTFKYGYAAGLHDSMYDASVCYLAYVISQEKGNGKRDEPNSYTRMFTDLL